MDGAFTHRQETDINRAIERAAAETGVRFSVYVGPGADGADFGRRLHADFGPAADHTVLIVVDPAARVVEIVTGERVRALVDDHASGLAVMSMATSFSVGDLAGGIRDGLNSLRERARRPPME